MERLIKRSVITGIIGFIAVFVIELIFQNWRPIVDILIIAGGALYVIFCGVLFVGLLLDVNKDDKDMEKITTAAEASLFRTVMDYTHGYLKTMESAKKWLRDYLKYSNGYMDDNMVDGVLSKFEKEVQKNAEVTDEDIQNYNNL